TVSPPIDPDAGLVQDCQAGDAEAFAELVARYRDGIYSFVRHTVGHEADAEDLAQEAFVRAYAAIGRFRQGAPFEPWLYTIAAILALPVSTVEHRLRAGRKALRMRLEDRRF